MRNLLAILAISAPTILAQALVSNTIAISSGSVAGSYAGKGIQKNAKTIFSKTGDVLDKSSESGAAVGKSSGAVVAPAAKMPPAPDYSAAPKYSGGNTPSSTASYAVRGRPSSAVPKKGAATIPHSEPLQFALPADAPLPTRAVSREMLSEIVTGTTREEVIARLGMPASRVNIPNGGTLEEIFYYTHAGEILGAVRVVDDSVSRVDINR